MALKSLELLEMRERNDNPNFKVVDFDHFKSEAGPPFKQKLLSPWERLGEGFRLKAENKETPGPLNRKRSRKGSRGQRLEINANALVKSSMDTQR